MTRMYNNWSILVLSTLFIYVNSQSHKDSPCPNIFQYTNIGGKWFGTITLRNYPKTQDIVLTVEYSVKNKLPSEDLGEIEVLGTDKTGVRNYKIRFPVQNPVPWINKIDVNGDEICGGTADYGTFYSGPITITCVSYGEKNTEDLSQIQHLSAIKNHVPGQSPCPDVFEYAHSGINGLYGLITLRGPQHYPKDRDITVTVEYSVTNRLPSDYIGKLELTDNLVNIPGIISRDGHLHYRINFPVQDPIPWINSIMVSGRKICNGFNDYGNYYTGPIGLSHKVFNTNPSHIITPWSEFDLIEPSNPPNLVQQRPTNSNLNQWSQFNIQPNNPTNGFFQNPTRPTQTNPTNIDLVQPTPWQENYDKFSNQPNWEVISTVTESPKPFVKPTQQNSIQSIIDSASNQKNVYANINKYSDICGVSKTKSKLVALLSNGQQATKGSFPWLATLYQQENGNIRFICGGSVISKRHVLTAAHCITHGPEDYLVMLGRYNIKKFKEENSTVLQVKSTKLHPDYDVEEHTADADIGIITVENDIDFNDQIRPICISHESPIPVNQNGILAGWGDDERGNRVSILRETTIPVIDSDICKNSNEKYRRVMTDRTFCAGAKGKGPCQGDSGGGFIMPENGRMHLRGIVSTAIAIIGQNCDVYSYSVFSDVTKYLDWINNVIQ